MVLNKSNGSTILPDKESHQSTWHRNYGPLCVRVGVTRATLFVCHGSLLTFLCAAETTTEDESLGIEQKATVAPFLQTMKGIDQRDA